MNIKYSPKQKIIATVLATSIMVTTVSICLTSSERNSILSSAIENTTNNSLVAEMSQQLSESYESMAQALAKNDTPKVQKIAKQTLGELDDIQRKINERNEEIKVVLEDINSDELNKNQKDYEKEIQNKLLKVENCLTEMSTSKENLNENVQEYSKLFQEIDSASEYVPERELENSITADYEVLDISKAENVTDEVEALSLDKTALSDADLSLTGDVAISDEIKLKADELKTPYAVYEFVKNNINYEAYYGARKGATGTYDSLAGNDTDTASLLIGMLRYLGYNAKYANGVIRMTSEQAMSVTGADNVEDAVQIFANLCKDVKTYASNGEITYVEMNRTWVEVYVPYTDYRGAGNAGGDSKWIPLDASFKKVELQVEQHSKNDSIITGESYYNTDESHNKAKELLSQLPEFEEIESLYGERMPETFNIYYTKNVQESIGYLPLSLEYTVISEKTSSVNIKLVSSDSVTISVGNDLQCTLRSADVYNKAVTLSYLPATSRDEALINRYGDIRKVPAHLLTLVPAITIDDVVVAKAGESLGGVSSGTKQTLAVTVNSSGETLKDRDTVYAGSVYTFVFHYGIISEKELSTAYEKAKEKNCHSTTMNSYSSEILGSFLDFAGKYYYSMIDVIDSYYSFYRNVNISRTLGVSILGYSLTSNSLLGCTTELTPGGFSIDVAFNTNAVVDRFAENNNSRTFNATIGYFDSMCEANLWEYLFQEGGVSTTEILSMAVSTDVKLHYLASTNKSEITELKISSNAIKEITDYINAGFIVIVPETEITIGEWTGTGYTAYNFDTGSSVYRISGGLNGGSSASPIDLTQAKWYAEQIPAEELNNYVYASIEIVYTFHNFYSMWNMYQLMMSVKKSELGLTWDLFNTTCSMAYDIQYYYGTLDSIIGYFGYDDEADGRMIVQNALSYLQSFCMDFLLIGERSIFGIMAIFKGFDLDFKGFLDNVWYIASGLIINWYLEKNPEADDSWEGYNLYAPSLMSKASFGLAFAQQYLTNYTLTRYPINT